MLLERAGKPSAPLDRRNRYHAGPAPAPVVASATAAIATLPDQPEAPRQVIVHPETGLVAVVASQAEQRKVADWLNAMQSHAQRQVLIEASIVEVALNDRYQAGIDWRWLTGGAGGWQLAQSLNGAALLDAPLALLSGGVTAGSNFALRWLEQFGQIRVLSSPKIMRSTIRLP